MAIENKMFNRFLAYRRSKKRKRLSRSLRGDIAVALFVTTIGLFMAIPLVYTIIQAFKPIEELFAYPPKFFVQRPTLDNFMQVGYLVSNLWVPFSRYLFNSVLISVVGTGAYVLIASLAAYPLAKMKFPGQAFINALIVLTLLFRMEVTAIPQYIVISGLGMINTYWSVILPGMSVTFGVFLMRQFMIASVPTETLEATRIDGASEYRIWLSVVMPSVKPGWLTLIIFTFQSFWNNGGANYIYDENLKSLPSVLSSIAAGGIARAGAGAAVAFIMMIPPIVVFVISQSSVMETMSYSGLK